MCHPNSPSAPGLCGCERVSQLTSDRVYSSFVSESIPRQTSSAHTQTPTLPDIVGRWVGPSGELRITDSGCHSLRRCEEEHRRIQDMNWTSEAPSVAHMLVSLGRSCLSICPCGISSAWCTMSVFSSSTVNEDGPMIPSNFCLPIIRSTSWRLCSTITVREAVSSLSFLLYFTGGCVGHQTVPFWFSSRIPYLV